MGKNYNKKIKNKAERGSVASRKTAFSFAPCGREVWPPFSCWVPCLQLVYVHPVSKPGFSTSGNLSGTFCPPAALKLLGFLAKLALAPCSFQPIHLRWNMCLLFAWPKSPSFFHFHSQPHLPDPQAGLNHRARSHCPHSESDLWAFLFPQRDELIP